MRPTGFVRDESANPPITDMIVHAANVAMGHQRKSLASFDHLIGDCEQLIWNDDGERIGCLEVDD